MWSQCNRLCKAQLNQLPMSVPFQDLYSQVGWSEALYWLSSILYFNFIVVAAPAPVQFVLPPQQIVNYGKCLTHSLIGLAMWHNYYNMVVRYYCVCKCNLVQCTGAMHCRLMDMHGSKTYCVLRLLCLRLVFSFLSSQYSTTCSVSSSTAAITRSRPSW